MSISAVEYLRHLLDETDFLTRRLSGVSKEHFVADETLKRAAVRSLEIIGEAVKRLPDDFRTKYNEVDWRSIAVKKPLCELCGTLRALRSTYLSF